MRRLPYFSAFVALFLIVAAVIIGQKDTQAAGKTCGNGVCQISLSENCSTCPADCGACPTTTPTPIPTNTVLPTSTPTPTITLNPTPTTYPTITPISSPNGENTPVPTNTTGTGDNGSSNSTTTEITSSISGISEFTNSSNLNLSAYASVSSGGITGIVFSYDDGTTWYNASPNDGNFDSTNERFTLFSPVLPDGNYDIKLRINYQGGISSYNYKVTILTTPPQITVSTNMSKPTTDQTPTISGSILSTSDVFAQISFDGGNTWYGITLNGSKFSFTRNVKLEDGNYNILIRARDLAGNISTKNAGELIIDTIPPIIGGNLVSIGSQKIDTDSSGLITTTVNTKNSITVSAKGGVIQVLGIADGNEFNFEKIPSTDLWQGEAVFQSAGLKNVEIVMKDGALNETKRITNGFQVLEAGKIINDKTKEPISEAQIKIYVFDTKNYQWALWQGEAYGQKNPTKSLDTGEYSFVLPKGKYYLEVSKNGYRTSQSRIFELSQTTVINGDFPLIPKNVFSFSIFPHSIDLHLNQNANANISTPDYLNKNINDFFPNIETKNESYDLIVLSIWSPFSSDQIKILKNMPGKVLIVFSQNSPNAAENFVRRGNYGFKYIIDRYGEISQNLGVNTLPHHLFVDKDGVIKNYKVGVFSENEIIAMLDSMK